MNRHDFLGHFSSVIFPPHAVEVPRAPFSPTLSAIEPAFVNSPSRTNSGLGSPPHHGLTPRLDNLIVLALLQSLLGLLPISFSLPSFFFHNASRNGYVKISGFSSIDTSLVMNGQLLHCCPTGPAQFTFENRNRVALKVKPLSVFLVFDPTFFFLLPEQHPAAFLVWPSYYNLTLHSNLLALVAYCSLAHCDFQFSQNFFLHFLLSVNSSCSVSFRTLRTVTLLGFCKLTFLPVTKVTIP